METAMTRDEILAMEAGLELNQAVAVHVMKWHRDPNRSGWWSEDGRCMSPGFTPAYSTDIAAAWEVVRRLWTTMNFDLFGNCGACGATFEGGKRTQTTECDLDLSDMPLAICRAALLATLAQEPA